jgi:acyl-coenzyme A thioesterase PaaI-like protein
MTTGTVAVTAAPVQQGRTQQLWDVRITDESGGESSHEERYGYKTWTPA